LVNFVIIQHIDTAADGGDDDDDDDDDDDGDGDDGDGDGDGDDDDDDDDDDGDGDGDGDGDDDDGDGDGDGDGDDDDDDDGDVFLLVDPLAHITRGLREHLMEKALRALVTPGYKDHIGLSAHNTTNW